MQRKTQQSNMAVTALLSSAIVWLLGFSTTVHACTCGGGAPPASAELWLKMWGFVGDVEVLDSPTRNEGRAPRVRVITAWKGASDGDVLQLYETSCSNELPATGGRTRLYLFGGPLSLQNLSSSFCTISRWASAVQERDVLTAYRAAWVAGEAKSTADGSSIQSLVELAAVYREANDLRKLLTTLDRLAAVDKVSAAQLVEILETLMRLHQLLQAERVLERLTRHPDADAHRDTIGRHRATVNSAKIELAESKKYHDEYFMKFPRSQPRELPPRKLDFRGEKVVDGLDFSAADLRGADMSALPPGPYKWTGAIADCSTRFPTGFELNEPMLIVGQCSLAQKAPPQSGGIVIRDKDLSGLDFRYSPNRQKVTFENVNLDGANFDDWDLSNSTSPSIKGRSSARRASFQNIIGTLHLDDELDLSEAVIIGARGVGDGKFAEHPRLMIYTRGVGPRIVGARIENAGIGILAATSLFRIGSDTDGIQSATIENSIVSCETPNASQFEDAIAPRSDLWSNLMDTLAKARNIGTRATNSIEPNCAKAIEEFLSGDCRAGHARVGAVYMCPKL